MPLMCAFPWWLSGSRFFICELARKVQLTIIVHNGVSTSTRRHCTFHYFQLTPYCFSPEPGRYMLLNAQLGFFIVFSRIRKDYISFHWYEWNNKIRQCRAADTNLLDAQSQEQNREVGCSAHVTGRSTSYNVLYFLDLY